MELTVEQKRVVKDLNKWVNDESPNAPMMAVLSGYAGTGKTTALKTFLAGYKKRVAVSAPTHKAVYVASTILGRKGQTLHSLHGLRPDVNLAKFDIDNIQFNPLGTATIDLYKLVIIDEAPMINKGVLELNAQRAELFNVKILFVGDALQLPPVGEVEGAAFKLPTQFKLTTVMRQHEENPVGYVMELLRNDIKNNSTYDAVNYMLKHPINTLKIDGVVSGYAILSKANFTDKLLDDFPRVKQGKDIMFMSFTNETVIDTNSYIRNNLIRSNLIVAEGDMLTSNINTYDEFQQVVLTNSSDYIVDSVEQIISDYDFEIFVVNLRNRLTNAIVPPIKIVDHTNEKGFERYKELLRVFRNDALNTRGRARGAKWYAYFTFKSTYLQMIQLTLDGKKLDRDISYGYATTIHKAQGSTYDIGYINLKEIVLTKKGTFRKNNKYQPHAIAQANRLLYVALSRAREKSILLWL